MACQNKIDRGIARDYENYYFCCYLKNKMVDHRDCEKCKEN